MRRMTLLVSVLLGFVVAVPAQAEEEPGRLALVAGTGASTGSIGVLWHGSRSLALLPSFRLESVEGSGMNRTGAAVGLSIRRYLGDDEALRPYLGLGLTHVDPGGSGPNQQRVEVFLGAQARLVRRVAIFARAGAYWAHQGSSGSGGSRDTLSTLTSSVGVAFYLK